MEPFIFSRHATMYDLQQVRERMALLARARSESTAEIFAQLDWLNQRLQAIEAQLGIVAPPAPVSVNPGEADIVNALEQLEKESPDPAPFQNGSSGLT